MTRWLNCESTARSTSLDARQVVWSAKTADALLRIVGAADYARIRAVAVHAKDDPGRAFYERLDFERSATDPYHLLLLMNDVRVLVAR